MDYNDLLHMLNILFKHYWLGLESNWMSDIALAVHHRVVYAFTGFNA